MKLDVEKTDIKNQVPFGAKGLNGATPEIIGDMYAWLEEYAKLTFAKYKRADEPYSGVGAAGGL